MNIECLTTFKHEGQEFQQGLQYLVTETLGTYFCASGWAKDLDGKMKTGTPRKTHTLRVDSLALQSH